MALHTVCPGLARPRAQDAQTYFAPNVQVGVDAVADVLNELDDGRDQRVVAGDLELELDELVAVDAVLGSFNVGGEVEHVFVFEEGDDCACDFFFPPSVMRPFHKEAHSE